MTQDFAMGPGDLEPEELLPVDRRETGLRLLLTVLFAAIAELIQALMVALVLFGLGVALLTRRPPHRRVREFANSLVGYSYRIGRYLTYNESTVPFPFAAFPEAPERPEPWSGAREAKAVGLGDAFDGDPDDEVDEDDWRPGA